MRIEKTVSFQLWTSKDVDHRLTPDKLLKIISMYENIFGAENLEVEIEYQTETVGKYALIIDEENFILMPKQTDCLAKDNCGVKTTNQELQLEESTTDKSCCTPGGGCC